VWYGYCDAAISGKTAISVLILLYEVGDLPLGIRESSATQSKRKRTRTLPKILLTFPLSLAPLRRQEYLPPIPRKYYTRYKQPNRGHDAQVPSKLLWIHHLLLDKLPEEPLLLVVDVTPARGIVVDDTGVAGHVAGAGVGWSRALGHGWFVCLVCREAVVVDGDYEERSDADRNSEENNDV
jgi:hypothetical protein